MIQFIKNLFSGKKEAIKEEPKAPIEEQKTESKKEPVKIPVIMQAEEEAGHSCGSGGCACGSGGCGGH